MTQTLLNRVLPHANGDHRRRVQVSVERITPAIAEEWLSKFHGPNRPLRKPTVRRYAAEMRNGRWALNGEAIKFDWDGLLRDGQHRLRAVIETGVTIETYVVRGLDPAVFPTLDGGAKRSAADHVAMMGRGNFVMLGQALSMLRRYERGDLASSTADDRYVSGFEVVEALGNYPEIEHSIPAGIACAHVMSRGQAVFFHFVFSRKHKALADEFFAALGSGIGMSATDPVYHLRERLLRHKSDRKSKLTSKYAMAIIVKAWNATVTGRPMGVLRWDTEREPFPEIA